MLAGANFSLPPVMSATGMESPAFTATLLSVIVPEPGSVVIFTANRLFAPLVLGAFASVGSVKPKSALMKV